MKLLTILAAIMSVTSAGQVFNNPSSSHFDYQQHQAYQPQDFPSQPHQGENPEPQRQTITVQSDHAVPQQYIYSQSQSRMPHSEMAIQSHGAGAPSQTYISQSEMPFHYPNFGPNQHPQQNFADISYHGLQAQPIQAFDFTLKQTRDGGARILAYQFDHDGHNYHYGYETDNGIKTQEAGTAIKGTIATGGYSYTGDDGQVYTVTYTADENGFRATGAHLPTPPPIPKEIAEALEKNARDEANGIPDDGKFVQKKQDVQVQEYQDEETYQTKDIRRTTPMSDSH